MIPKYKQRSYILDKLHRGAVNICLFATVASGGLLVYKIYDYYWNIRPALKAVQTKAVEELLDEGKYIEMTD